MYGENGFDIEFSVCYRIYEMIGRVAYICSVHRTKDREGPLLWRLQKCHSTMQSL